MNAAATLRDFHDDRRGAVMMIGLGMATFLIGALWFIIGIGDAIVFRDTMQEATDSSAFTSAALHAKGMNFISAMNLIIFVAMVIYIAMGIMHDILLGICLAAGWASFGTACIPWIDYRPYWTGYAKGMKAAVDVIHYGELAAAYGYPFLAAYKAYKVSSNYGQNSGPQKRNLHTVAFSPSLIPGKFIVGPINAAITSMGGPDTATSGDSKKGLPVHGKPWKSVCERVGAKATSWISGAVGKAVGTGVAFVYCNDLGSGGDISDKFDKVKDKQGKYNEKCGGSEPDEDCEGTYQSSGSVGGDTGTGGASGGKKGGILGKLGIDISIGSNAFIVRADKWWGKEGPLVPWANNGSPWMQTWAVNFKPAYTDHQEHNVAIAARKVGVESSANPYFYVSQSEFYYDCKEDWDNEECDGDDNAGYGLRWRARLHRVQFPGLASMLTSVGGNFLTSIKGYSEFKDGLVEDLMDATGVVGGSVIGSLINSGLEQVEGAIKKALNNVGGAADGAVNDFLTGKFGMYH